MNESKKAGNCNSLQRIIQEHEQSGICGFHYYPEDSGYATLTLEDAENIVKEVRDSCMHMVVRNGKRYFVEDFKVRSKGGEVLSGFIQIWPVRILQL